MTNAGDNNDIDDNSGGDNKGGLIINKIMDLRIYEKNHRKNSSLGHHITARSSHITNVCL
jgi:hypothetical protein